MSAAVETLLLAFREEGGLAVPARALFVGAEPHPVLREWPEVTGWQPFRPAAAAWEAAGMVRVAKPAGRFPLVMVLPGRAREEVLAWFALARAHLEPGGQLVAAMPNLAGAARFESELQRACGAVTSLHKHKCRVFGATEDGTWQEEMFAEWRQLGEPRPVAGTRMIAQAGLFSAGHPDPGSLLLAEHLPVGLRGRVADLGAGWGLLADAILRRCPGVAAVDLFEADARALDCARHNLRDHGDRARFFWHDVRGGVPEGYDAVVMNPPFHEGRDTRVEVGWDFIAAAARALRRGGGLYLVANRQLPYEAALSALGLSWRTAGENSTYKLAFAVKNSPTRK